MCCSVISRPIFASSSFPIISHVKVVRSGNFLIARGWRLTLTMWMIIILLYFQCQSFCNVFYLSLDSTGQFTRQLTSGRASCVEVLKCAINFFISEIEKRASERVSERETKERRLSNKRKRKVFEPAACTAVVVVAAILGLPLFIYFLFPRRV